MLGWIAPTDNDWFDFLAAGPAREEVNFWTPSDYFTFHAAPGTPFLFKLKSPRNAIGGFGFFRLYDAVPEWYAWECFREANGAPSFEAMKHRLDGFRRRNRLQGRAGIDQIGCIILSAPVFFPPELWTPQPSDWPPRNLRPMRYDLSKDEGKRVWDHCLPTSVALSGSVAPQPLAASERHGVPTLVTPRLGQGAFRFAVTRAYERACAATGEHSLPALEAAHIVPFSEGGPHEVSNGLLLRSDVHKLFDAGYVSISPDYRVLVSDQLKSHYKNGRTYYPYRGQPLVAMPERVTDRPDPQLLRWHNEYRFLG